MPGPRLREAQADLAITKILDGAARAFVELGVSGSGMAEIAEYAGCSRGTLYRYFKNRHALHLEFVADRTTRLVSELRSELARLDDPSERLIAYVIGAVKLVRGEPALAAWFEPDESGATARMSRGSEVVDRFTRAFVSDLLGENSDAESNRLAARYMVRMIISLLATPGENAKEERAMIERFVVPSILHGSASDMAWGTSEVG